MQLLSIIIPAYNSQDKIKELISKIKNVPLQIEKEIIVVDDHSKDKTYTILKQIPGIRLYHHTKNTGKGGAVKTGLEHAKGDILFLHDDDLEYDPRDIPVIIAPILEQKAELVFGSRRMNKNNKYSSLLYYLGGVFIDFIISTILQSSTTDAITGSKTFTRNVYKKIKPIESKGFEIESEIVAKAIRNGIKPLEVPISYTPRTHAEGKNIRWHHAYPIIKTLIKYAYFS